MLSDYIFNLNKESKTRTGYTMLNFATDLSFSCNNVVLQELPDEQYKHLHATVVLVIGDRDIPAHL